MSPKSYVGSSAARRKIETQEPSNLILHDLIVFQHCRTFSSLRSRILTSTAGYRVHGNYAGRTVRVEEGARYHPGSHKRLNDESSRQRESQAGLAHTGHTISPNPTILAQH